MQLDAFNFPAVPSVHNRCITLKHILVTDQLNAQILVL